MSDQYHGLKALPSLFLAHATFFLYKHFPQQISFLFNPIYPILTSSQRTQAHHVVYPHSVLLFSIVVIFLLCLPIKALSLPDLSLFLIPCFSKKYVSRFLSHADQIYLFAFSYIYRRQVLKSKFLPGFIKLFTQKKQNCPLRMILIHIVKQLWLTQLYCIHKIFRDKLIKILQKLSLENYRGYLQRNTKDM